MCQRLMGSHCRLQPGSNTECKSGRGAGEVERRTEVKGEEADIFSLVFHSPANPYTFLIRLLICLCIQYTCHNIWIFANEEDWMVQAERLPRGEIPHGEQAWMSRTQWALRMILCPNVTPVGRGLFSEAPLMTSSSNPQPKGFQAPCAAPPGGS